MCKPDDPAPAIERPAQAKSTASPPTPVPSRGHWLQFACGLLVSLNFVVFWAVPIFVQGQIWHLGLKHVLRPVFNLLDQSTALRGFATRYLYTKPQYADFFASALLVSVSSAAAFAVVLRAQLVHGSISWPLLVAYNFAWVGLGGRAMGTAYTFAHKEG